ncbi:MAG: hypothetical protein K2Q22_11785 [Cytophagales bacterium]|nr:hypothetical protein [Cytophagales bacterium]
MNIIRILTQRIFALVILLLTVGLCTVNAQPPNNCELCYSTYVTDEAALAQCLIDYNCVNDIPIDFGVEYLALGGFLLIAWSFYRKFRVASA